MSTKDDLQNGLKQAMKSNNEIKKRTLRMALAAVRQAEIDGGKPLEESQVLSILQKEIKSRQESIAEAQRANRPDLETASKDEIVVLETYLPKQLSADEIDALARQAVAETGATSVKEMGLVMKVLMPRLQGRGSGDQASQAVKKLLAG